jgi:alkylated DNA repair dioxygenase AlkB
MIAGIQYVPDYLDQDTHDRLLAAVDERPWQTSVDHGVQVYGYSYNHKQRVAFRIGELPVWAMELAERLHDDGYAGSVPNQLVANAYAPGTGIFDHTDQAVFGDVVIAVSLGSTCVMRFTRLDADAAPELLLEPRSLLVLSGEARWNWRHGIPGRLVDPWNGRNLVRGRRVSLTVRTVPAAEATQTTMRQSDHGGATWDRS